MQADVVVFAVSAVAVMALAGMVAMFGGLIVQGGAPPEARARRELARRELARRELARPAAVQHAAPLERRTAYSWEYALTLAVEIQKSGTASTAQRKLEDLARYWSGFRACPSPPTPDQEKTMERLRGQALERIGRIRASERRAR